MSHFSSSHLLPERASLNLSAAVICAYLILSQKHLSLREYHASPRAFYLDFCSSQALDVKKWLSDFRLLLESFWARGIDVQETSMTLASWEAWAKSRGCSWLKKRIFLPFYSKKERHKLNSHIIDVLRIDDFFLPKVDGYEELLCREIASQIAFLEPYLLKKGVEEACGYTYRLEGLGGVDAKELNKFIRVLRKKNCNLQELLNEHAWYIDYGDSGELQGVFSAQALGYIADFQARLHATLKDQGIVLAGTLPLSIVEKKAPLSLGHWQIYRKKFPHAKALWFDVPLIFEDRANFPSLAQTIPGNERGEVLPATIAASTMFTSILGGMGVLFWRLEHENIIELVQSSLLPIVEEVVKICGLTSVTYLVQGDWAHILMDRLPGFELCEGSQEYLTCIAYDEWGLPFVVARVEKGVHLMLQIMGYLRLAYRN